MVRMMKVDDTILSYIKTQVDIATDDDTSYDDRLIQEIENVIGELHLLTPVKTFTVTEDTTFTDIFQDSANDTLSLVRRFISIGVRLSFDPPTGSVLTSLERIKDNTASMITVLRSYKLQK